MALGRFLAPAVLGAALMGLAASGAHATVAETITTYDFAGACSDCAGTAHGELELLNYTPGDMIDTSNFVSFHYDGTNLLDAYTVTDAEVEAVGGSVGGELVTLPGPNNFHVFDDDAFFYSSSEGNWCTGGGCLADQGATHVWSAAVSGAPEPATWGMMLLGVAGIGYAFRQAKLKHGFRFKAAFTA